MANKRVKKPNQKTLKKDIWTLCKEIIRKEYGNTCYTCDQKELKGSNWHTGHFIPKSVCKGLFKYDLRNLRPQCYRCNIHLGGFGAEFSRRMAKIEGRAFMHALFLEQIKEYAPIKTQDLLDLKDKLEKRLKESAHK
jgi:hypothetical protein